jgi:hypothetical protein
VFSKRMDFILFADGWQWDSRTSSAQKKEKPGNTGGRPPPRRRAEEQQAQYVLELESHLPWQDGGEGSHG